jgi:hypothetical protein
VGNKISVHSTFEATLGNDSLDNDPLFGQIDYPRKFTAIPGLSTASYTAKGNRPLTVSLYKPSLGGSLTLSGKAVTYGGANGTTSANITAIGQSVCIAGLTAPYIGMYIGFDLSESTASYLHSIRSGLRVLITWFDVEYSSANTAIIAAGTPNSNDITLADGITVNGQDITNNKVLTYGGADQAYSPAIDNYHMMTSNILNIDYVGQYTYISTEVFTVSNMVWPMSAGVHEEHHVTAYGITESTSTSVKGTLVAGTSPNTTRSYASHYVSKHVLSVDQSITLSGKYSIVVSAFTDTDFMPTLPSFEFIPSTSADNNYTIGLFLAKVFPTVGSSVVGAHAYLAKVGSTFTFKVVAVNGSLSSTPTTLCTLFVYKQLD